MNAAAQVVRDVLPADPVREHVESLRRRGMSLQAISDASGQHRGVLMDLLLGPRVDGTNRRGDLREFVAKARAEAILSVRCDGSFATVAVDVVKGGEPIPEPPTQRGALDEPTTRVYAFLAEALAGVDLEELSRRWKVSLDWLTAAAEGRPVTRQVATAVNLALVSARNEARSYVTSNGWGHKMLREGNRNDGR